MRVLVTGATGLLGRMTAERLITAGHTVTVMQRHTSGLAADEIIGDITVASDVSRAMAGQDGVVHLAARVAVTGHWDEFARTNVEGTRTMLTGARRAGVHRFVHVSTPSVAHAGDALVGAPAGAADPGATRGHYATSKALAENLALTASDDAMSVVAVRPHLVWGPGDTQLVGRIVERARAGRLALVGHGGALVDSTYVDNAADALVAALRAAPRIGGRSFVVSNGEPRTIAELVGRIVAAVGLGPPTRHVPAGLAFSAGIMIEKLWGLLDRTDDPPMTSFLAEQLSTAHWFDQRTTREVLDWEPAVTLDEGFTRLQHSFDDD